MNTTVSEFKTPRIKNCKNAHSTNAYRFKYQEVSFSMLNRRNVTIKFLLTAVILGVILPRIGAVTMWQALFTAAVVTLLGYVIDFVMISKVSGLATLVLDAVLNTFIIWLVQLITPFMYVPFTGAFIASLFLTVSELFLHNFLQRQYSGNR
jgi:hypothetical protein